MKFSLFSLISIVLLGSCSSKEENSLKPKLGTITESVYASGTVKAENQYTVYATVSGVLKQINAVAGQAISQGQALFLIDSEKAALQTENAQLAYQLSQENNRYIQDKIGEMELRVQDAKDKLSVEQSVYNRNKNIKAYNVISEVAYEKVELAYKNSKNNYEAAVKQLAQLRAQVQNEQRKSNINLHYNQKNEGDFTIRSAVNGELFDVLVKEGALISPQTPLAVIGKKGNYVLELEVDENDMALVALGQTLLVTLDSYKGHVFSAAVDKIYPIMDLRSRTFKIEAHFVKTPPKLYPNLTAEANIIIQEKKNALTIPKSYLVNDTYVMVSKTEKRKVNVGISDYYQVEITAGLTAQDVIFKP
jgi:multidrug efflux pump subunit AcrA (membrane-fusion protein)